MDNLKVSLKNCYGINSLDYDFDFTPGAQAKPKEKVYAVYAPNGLMKSSFAKTFDVLSKGETPREERYDRQSTWVVESDGVPLTKEAIYVLKAEIDITSDSHAVTDILVNPEHKARYDELIVDLDKKKGKLINALRKKSKIKKGDIERTILDDWGAESFQDCIYQIRSMPSGENLEPYEYATIFDPKTTEVLKSQDFVEKSNEFNKRYQQLFNQTGTIYVKGVFNPAKADASFSTLDKQGFFAGGHRVHLKGDSESIDKEELDKKIEALHVSIDSDPVLKNLRTNLAKNAQTQALTDLIERLSSHQVEYLLDRLKPESQAQFRKELWIYYIHSSSEAGSYVDAYVANRSEINQIESAASQEAPRWKNAVNLFNERFIDMPFSLSVLNQSQAALGKENAKLKFTFRDGEDTVEWSRSEVRTLSQGEKRALYLLYFIFDVEARKLTNQGTLFVIDDVADSFDYKNKHAIVQYLHDICAIDNFYQIILTHNFDFYRSVGGEGGFVHRTRCLMANKEANRISLSPAEGINNIFTRKWKERVHKDEKILCATIPFTRNLIEYIKGVQDPDYLTLTSLLHWKNDTDQISVGNYLDIYNRLFGCNHDCSSAKSLKDLLFEKADEVAASQTQDGLNLEDKVLLSMAIRLKAEMFITDSIRSINNDPGYWCQANSQFGRLMRELTEISPNAPELRTLEKVSITVSSNIHLNSFMYEPILDLTIEHLIELYTEVSRLGSGQSAE